MENFGKLELRKLPVPALSGSFLLSLFVSTSLNQFPHFGFLEMFLDSYPLFPLSPHITFALPTAQARLFEGN